MPASGCPATGDGVGTTEGEADADGLGVGVMCGFGDALARADLVGVGGATELGAGALLTGAAAGEVTAADRTADEAADVATTGDEAELGPGLADTASVGATAAVLCGDEQATSAPSVITTHARRVVSAQRGMLHADTT